MSETPQTPSNTDVFNRLPEVVCVEQPGGVLAIMIGGVRGHFFVLDGCAAECFQLLDGERSIENIATEVGRNNGVDGELVLKDFKSLVQELLAENLIE